MKFKIGDIVYMKKPFIPDSKYVIIDIKEYVDDFSKYVIDDDYGNRISTTESKLLSLKEYRKNKLKKIIEMK